MQDRIKIILIVQAPLSQSRCNSNYTLISGLSKRPTVDWALQQIFGGCPEVAHMDFLLLIINDFFLKDKTASFFFEF